MLFLSHKCNVIINFKISNSTLLVLLNSMSLTLLLASEEYMNKKFKKYYVQPPTI